MAIKKIRDDKANNKYNDIIDDSNDQDTMMVFLKKLSEKIDESVDKTNEHITKMGVNDAKVGMRESGAEVSFEFNAKTSSLRIKAVSGKNTFYSDLKMSLLKK